MVEEDIRLWSPQESADPSNRTIGTFLSRQPSLTLYPAAQPRRAGAVLICPGGGYQGLTPHEQEPVARKLNAFGFDAFLLRYRTHPDLHPAPYQDVKRAIELVRQRVKRVAVMGFSAGGHVAASAGTLWDHEDSRPDALILAYPVISLGKAGHAGSRRHLLGDQPNEALISDLSLENRVTRKTPPTYLWHTADDELVPVENSLLLATALSAKQVPYACRIYPSGLHGLGLAEDHPQLSGWFEEALAFLGDFGF